MAVYGKEKITPAAGPLWRLSGWFVVVLAPVQAEFCVSRVVCGQGCCSEQCNVPACLEVVFCYAAEHGVSAFGCLHDCQGLGCATHAHCQCVVCVYDGSVFFWAGFVG